MTLRTKYGEAIITSPFEVFTYFITLPPVKSDHVEGAVRFRLRSIHPGDPLSTIVDIRPAALRVIRSRKSADGTMTVIAHVTSSLKGSDTFHGEDEPANRIALIPGSSLLGIVWLEYASDHPGNGTVIGVLISTDWIQCICYRDGIAVAGTACRYSTVSELTATLSTALDTFNDHVGDTERKALFLIRMDDDSAPLSAPISGYLDPVIIPTELLSKKVRVDRERLFNPARKNKPIIRKIVISSLIVLNLLLAGIRLNRIASAYEAEAVKQKNAYEAKKSSSFEIIALQKELETLAANDATAEASVGIDVYSVFERLSIDLQRATLDSFTLQGSTLKFTARTSDALSCVEKLQSDPFFDGIALVQATPSTDGGEEFTVSGRIAR